MATIRADSSSVVLRGCGHLLTVGVEGHGARVVALGLCLLGLGLLLGLLLGLVAHHAEVTVSCREAVSLHWKIKGDTIS